MTIEEARRQFPVLDRFAYLNAGTNGPLARATVDAMDVRTVSVGTVKKSIAAAAIGPDDYILSGRCATTVGGYRE